MRPEVETEGNVEFHFQNCPMLFITKSVWSFYRRYRYQKEIFPAAPIPDYRETSARWVQACFYFDNKVKEYAKG